MALLKAAGGNRWRRVESGSLGWSKRGRGCLACLRVEPGLDLVHENGWNRVDKDPDKTKPVVPDTQATGMMPCGIHNFPARRSRQPASFLSLEAAAHHPSVTRDLGKHARGMSACAHGDL